MTDNRTPYYVGTVEIPRGVKLKPIKDERLSYFNRKFRNNFFEFNMPGYLINLIKKAEIRKAREAKRALVCAKQKRHIWCGNFYKGYRKEADRSLWRCKRCGIGY
jgi:hypothetical protein